MSRCRFRIGERVTVTDINSITRFGETLPMVGWIDAIEEQDGSWYIFIRPDHPKGPTIAYRQEEVSRVEVTCYGRLVRTRASAMCPWCTVHGRDPRWPEGVLAHPSIPDCTCWWHTHVEHMPNCPFGGMRKHQRHGKERKET